MAVPARLAAPCGFCLERGCSLLPFMLPPFVFSIPLNPDPKSGVPLGQVPSLTSPFAAFDSFCSSHRRWLCGDGRTGPRGFPDGPQRPRRRERGPSTCSTSPSHPSLWLQGETALPPTLPPKHTLQTFLSLNYSPASPQGCCRTPSPGAKQEKGKKKKIRKAH